MLCVLNNQRSKMCDCKNKVLRRAKTLLNGRKWEDLNIVEQGQIEGLFHEKHGTYGSEEEIINWLNN